MNKLQWYGRRLSNMSLAELLYRVGQAASVQYDRVKIVGETGWPDDAILWSGLGQTGSHNWWGWGRHVQGRQPAITFAPQNRNSFKERFPAEYLNILKQASEALQGRVRLFQDHLVSLGNPPDWHRDPVTGRSWPANRFYADINFRWGGAKTIWEPARHQHLVTLCQAGWFSNDQRYGSEVVKQLSDWFKQNPAYRGVHWASGLELAVRLANWIWIDALLDRNLAPPHFWREWTRAVVAQGTYLARHLSGHSSANNHLIGEAAGLVFASHLVPEWKHSPAWRQKGRSIIEAEFLKQIHSDGVPAEQAIHYLSFILDFYVLVLRLSSFPEIPVKVAQRLCRAGEFLASIRNSAGVLPAIGDCDAGRAYSVTTDEPNIQSRLIVLEAVLKKDASPWSAGLLDSHSWWLLGEQSVRKNPCVSKRAAGSLRSFSQGGYWIIRESKNKEKLLLFDCGPLGYLSIAAHGHADCLSIQLSVDGKWMLIDPGTYVYHEEPEWRRYFRGSSAHNTVVLDSSDQSVQTGSTMWGKKARAKPICSARLDYITWVEGEHDGYMRLPSPAIHRRGLGLTGSSYIVVVDWIISKGAHQVEANYHFPPEAEILIDGKQVRVQDPETTLTFLFLSEPELTLVKGQLRPPQGWISPQFGTKDPAPVLNASQRIYGTVALFTIILLDWSTPPPSRIWLQNEEYHLEVRMPEWSDELVFSLRTTPHIAGSLVRYSHTPATVSN